MLAWVFSFIHAFVGSPIKNPSDTWEVNRYLWSNDAFLDPGTLTVEQMNLTPSTLRQEYSNDD